MREVLEKFRRDIDASDVLHRLGLTTGEYFVVSAHREENVDHPQRLERLLDSLVAVRNQFGKRLVVSTHPRTRMRLGGLEGDHDLSGIEFMEPFGFHDYNKLQLESACVLSDSGTISEESSILGFSAVTLRESIERPEALDTGSIIMTGLDTVDVVTAVGVAMADGPVVSSRPIAYEVVDTSNRVVRFILSTASRHQAWAGIRP